MEQKLEKKQQEKKEIYPNIKQGFGIIGIAILAGIVIGILFLPFNKIITKDISQLFNYVILMGVTFYIVNRQRQRINGIEDKVFNLKIDSFVAVILLAITTIAISTGFIQPVSSIIPIPDFVKELLEGMFGQAGIFSFITIVIAAPILEEFIFRGIVLDGFLKRYSPLKSILMSSFLFGLIHLNPWQFIAAMVIGIFMGWVYYRTRKLSYTIIIHAVNNGFAFLLVWLDKKGIVDSGTFLENYTPNMIIIASAVVIAVAGLLLLNKLLPKTEEYYY